MYHDITGTEEVSAIYVRILGDDERVGEKAKTAVQWVPSAVSSDAATAAAAKEVNVPLEVRLYQHLFVREEPNDATWEAELNPNSEVVVKTALADPSLLATLFPAEIAAQTPYVHNDVLPQRHVQFERVGFFVLDRDTVFDPTDSKKNRIVLNLTVTLKDSKPETEGGAAGAKASESSLNGEAEALRLRKEEQARALAEKQVRMTMSAKEYFTTQCLDQYSAFDNDGVPTHDAKGEKLSKSAAKKAKKDWEKQQLLHETYLSKQTAK